MQQVGLRVTMIATPQLATDLIGPATQATSADMIVPALGFTDCVPFARALAQVGYSKPVLSTPLCTFIPKAAYAGGDLPKWTFGIAQTLVNLRRLHPGSVALASTVARWTIANMQDPTGYFYYRKYPLITNKTPTLHWGQATMFAALALLDQNLRSQAGASTAIPPSNRATAMLPQSV